MGKRNVIVVAAALVLSLTLTGAGGGCEREGGRPRPKEDPAALDKAGENRASALLSVDWEGEREMSIGYNDADGFHKVTQRAQKASGGFFRQAVVIPKGKSATLSVAASPTGSSRGKVSCRVKWGGMAPDAWSKSSPSGSVGPCRLNATNDDDRNWPPRPARKLDTLTYEGMVIQFPDGAPSAQRFRQAQNDRSAFVYIVQWRGNRSVAIDWTRSSPTLPAINRYEVVNPAPASNGVSTWAVIMEAERGSFFDIGSVPRPGGSNVEYNRGFNRCVGYYRGEKVEDNIVESGSVSCAYLVAT